MNAADAIRGIPVIDADTHLTEPHDLWTSRAPAALRDRVPQVVDVGGVPSWSVDGIVLGRASAASVVRVDGTKSRGSSFIGWTIDDTHPAAYDVDARLAVMDELGIWAQVVYPNAAGFGAQRFSDVKDGALRRLCATLYNDAMVELQDASKGRLLPMALMPWWNIEDTVAEVGRVATLGLHGINMCSDPQSRGLPDLGDRAWDPFWSACCDHDTPVNFHIGSSDNTLGWFGSSPWPSQDDDKKLAIGSAMMYLTNAMVIANLIFSGVFERFPKLRVVSVESGVGWIPFLLDALDYQLLETAPRAVEELSLKPSEYFRRQIYACFWFEGDGLDETLRRLGPGNVLFETDFPHPTCLYPDAMAHVASALTDVPDETRRRILHDNAAELYRITTPANS